jgi:hypothetical protein
MQAKHKNTGRWEGVNFKQNTGHYQDTAATATANPEPSGSGSGSEAAVHRASHMGRAAHAGRCPCRVGQRTQGGVHAGSVSARRAPRAQGAGRSPWMLHVLASSTH